MERYLFVAALICLGAQAAFAGPYFRLIDPANPHRVAGAFIDPSDLKNTSAGTAVALITHSTSDGCFMPSIVCEDWSPLMAGFSYNAGRFQFNVGPAVNLAPVAKRGLLGALNAFTADDKYLGVKGLLGSEPIGGPDVSISFGPAIAVTPVQRGVILPLNQWQGKFRVFAGAALKFSTSR